MLSAAHDIIHSQTRSKLNDSNPSNPRDCNQLSTSVILLMDIIPSLVIKLIAPLLPLCINTRMVIVCTFSILGFLIPALATDVWVSFIGIACVSLSSGLGETTLLSYAVFFDNKNVISAWSSGTGGAGFFGSLSYAALIAIGLTPNMTLFLLIIIPIIAIINFWFILPRPDISYNLTHCTDDMNQVTDSSDTVPRTISARSFSARVKYFPSVLRYLVPLMLVYVFEYFINQGLYELLYFKGIYLSHGEQYRWYQVLYQIGVFISRSSRSVFIVEKIWVLSILQGITTVYFIFDSIYQLSPCVYLVFAIILWEGLIGGMAYVNVFYKIKKEVKLENQEIATGMTSLGDSIGITMAGFLAMPVHNYICSLPLKSTFRS